MTDIARLGIAVEGAATVNQATTALDKLNASAAKVEATTKAMGKSTGDAAKTAAVNIDAINASVGRAAPKMDALAASAGKTQRAIGLAAHEMTNLSRQIQDVATMAAMGASPMQILSSQGAQLFDIFSSSQGSLRGFGQQIMSVLTPTRLLAGGLMSVGAAAAYAAVQYASAQKALETSLLGRGRGSGQTVGGLNQIAESAAAASGGALSRSQTRGMAGSLASTGAISGNLMPGIIGMSRGYGRITGQSEEDAVGDLGKAFADPAKGAEDLDKALGFLTPKLREYIAMQQGMGNLAGAQKALFDAVQTSLVGATRETRVWVQALTGLSNIWDTVGASINNALSPDKMTLLERARRDVAFLSAIGATGLAGKAQQNVNAIQLSMGKDALRAAAGARSAESTRTADAADPVIRRMIPEIGELRDNARDKGLLQKLMGDSGALARLGVTAEQAQEALKRLSVVLETASDKAREDGDLQLKAINASTLQQRADVEAQRARVDVMRTSRDTVLAGVEAENARNRVIAEANRNAREALRDARDEASLVGLKPYQRGRQQLLNTFARQNEATATGSMAGAGGAPAARSAIPGISDFETATGVTAGSGRATLGSIAAGGGYRTAGSHVDMAGLTPVFADVLQKLTAGLAVTITSAYRSAEYNAGIPGAAPNSNHTKGTAADVAASPGVIDEIKARAAQMVGVRVMASQRGAFHIDMPGGAAGMRSGGAFATGTGGGAPALSATTAEEQRTRLGTYDETALRGPIDDAKTALAEQIALTNAQAAAFGLSAQKAAELAAQQQLVNQYARAGIDETTIGTEAYSKLAEQIAEVARQSGEAAEKQRKLNESQKQITELNSALADTTKGFFADLRAGKSVVDSLTNALNRMLDKLLDMSINSLFSAGGAPGGLLGQIFGSLFKSANGNIFAGGRITPFASGGIVNRPTLFPMANGMGLMGEAGPEAVMPLRRGADGKLGVAAANDNRRAQVVNMGGITITGNVTPDTIPLLEAAMRQQQQQIAELSRSTSKGFKMIAGAAYEQRTGVMGAA